MNYKDSKWEQKRNFILRRDNYLCQESKRYGKRVDANTVHHIYPVEYYPELKYVNWNLISLSSSYHNKMHDRITNEITGIGKVWQEKVRDKFDEWMEKKKINPPSEKFDR